LLKPLNKKDGC